MRTISSDELADWAAFYTLDPWGTYRGDVQAGVVASTMANIHAKRGHKFSPKDFCPTFGEARTDRAMSPQEIHARMEVMMAGRRHGTR